MKKLLAIFIVILLPLSLSYAQKRSNVYKDYYDGKNNYNYSDSTATKSSKATTSKKSSTATSSKKSSSSATSKKSSQKSNIKKSSAKSSSNKRYSGAKSFLNEDILRHRILLEPQLHIPLGIRSDKLQEHLKVAGGVRLGYQYNFYNWLGLRGDIGYIYGSASYDLNAPHYEGGKQHERLSTHQIDIRVMAVLEYRPKKGNSGINPYFMAGATFSTAINFLKETHRTYLPNPDNFNYPELAEVENNFRRDDFNIGLTIGAGFNYIFKNGWSVGGGLDYILVIPYWDNSGFRIFINGSYLF